MSSSVAWDMPLALGKAPAFAIPRASFFVDGGAGSLPRALPGRRPHDGHWACGSGAAPQDRASAAILKTRAAPLPVKREAGSVPGSRRADVRRRACLAPEVTSYCSAELAPRPLSAPCVPGTRGDASLLQCRTSAAPAICAVRAGHRG
jgi:hypothetical protein